MKPIKADAAPMEYFRMLYFGFVLSFSKQVNSPDTFFHNLSIIGPSRPLKENKDSLTLKIVNNAVVFLIKNKPK